MNQQAIPFSFEFKNAPSNLRSILNPQVGLINVENGLEGADNNLNSDLFNPAKKKKQQNILLFPQKDLLTKATFYMIKVT